MSNKVLATNDSFIEDLINDSNYQINSDGSILTLITTTGKISVGGNWRFLSVRTTRNGYADIAYKNKKLLLHRVVYRKFIGPLNDTLTINHKDGNPLNNNISNLELVSQSENNTHRFRVLGHKPVYGNTVIIFDIADEIREKKKQGLTHKQLCQEYNLSKGHISEIVNNKIWVR